MGCKRQLWLLLVPLIFLSILLSSPEVSSQTTPTPTYTYSPPPTPACSINTPISTTCYCGTPSTQFSYGYCCGSSADGGTWSAGACITSTPTPVPTSTLPPQCPMSVLTTTYCSCNGIGYASGGYCCPSTSGGQYWSYGPCTSTTTPISSPTSSPTTYCALNQAAYSPCTCGTDSSNYVYGKYCCGSTSASGTWSSASYTPCSGTTTYSPPPYTSPTSSYTPYPTYAPPSTSCSSSSIWNCYDSTSCTNAGGQWSIPPAGGTGYCSQKCSSSNIWSCYDQTSCTNAGGQWNSNACTQKCSSSNIWSCYDKASCTGTGGNWCGNYCQTSQCPTCSSSQAYNCYDQTSCSGAGGVWCKSSSTSGGNCNSAGYNCPTCSKDQAWNCYDEASCKSAGGYWSSMSRYCSNMPQDETSCKSANKNWCTSSPMAYPTITTPTSSGWCSDMSCPTYTCSKTETWNCRSETECKNVGAYWYNNYCSSTPPPKCEYSNPWNCYDKASCTGIGRNWCTSQYSTGMSSGGWCTDSTCPTYTCSKSETWNCKSETECKSAGGYWYNNYCSSNPPPKCESTQAWNCYDESSCTSVGAKWCKTQTYIATTGSSTTGYTPPPSSGYCSSSCPTCSKEQTWNCYDKSSCTGSGGNWCQSGGSSSYYCSSSLCPVCSSSQVWNCYEEAACKSAGGYWFNNYCSSSPPPVCESSKPWNCFDQSACTGAGGEWCISPPPVYATSTTSAVSGTAASIPLNYGWCTSKGSCPYKTECSLLTMAVPICSVDQTLEKKTDSKGCVTGYECRRLSQCSAIYKPVCGSDGNTHNNECEAKAAGVGVQHQGGCLIEAKCDKKLFDPIFECKKNKQDYEFETDQKTGCPIAETVKCIDFKYKCPVYTRGDKNERAKCEKSGGKFEAETDTLGCTRTKCNFPNAKKCKEVKDEESGMTRMECDKDINFCPPTPSQKEQDSMKTECTKYGGVFSMKTENSCTFPDCRFEGDIDHDNPFGRLECPTNVDLERKGRACEAMGGTPAIRFVGGCKISKCNREEEACSVNEVANKKAEEKCKEEGKHAVKKFDKGGCEYVSSCGAAEQCDKELPAIVTANCVAKGGEYIVKKSENGCIEFAECIEPGKKTDEISVTPVKEVPDVIAILDIALKLEEVNVALDKLVGGVSSLADYYKSAGNLDEAEKFEKIAGILDSAKKQTEKIKDKLKSKLDKITVDELMEIKKDMVIMKDSALKEVLYMLLGTKKEEVAAKVEFKDCGSDGECFGKAFASCSKATYSPKVPSGPSPVLKIDGLSPEGSCLMTASLSLEGKEYSMKCSVEDYTSGIQGPEDLTQYCAGNMVDLISSGHFSEGTANAETAPATGKFLIG